MQSYIALGDSISIDSYPAMDAELPSTTPRGAASVLGRSLLGLAKIDEVFNLAEDGATMHDVLRAQLPKIPESRRLDANLITLTIGGNDISFAGMRAIRDLPSTGARSYMEKFSWEIKRIQEEYDDTVSAIRAFLPRSGIILNTLYDPTDGLGSLPASCGEWAEIAPWYSRGRRELGDYIRWRYDGNKYGQLVRVADIFKVFDGRGMAQDDVSKRWYYAKFMIEPSHTGAYEIAKEWSQHSNHLLVSARMHWSTRPIPESVQPAFV